MPRAKLYNYLLDLGNPRGRSKARFFLGRGFRREEWEPLAASLRSVGLENDAVHVAGTPTGVKYVVDGSIATPDGRGALIRTVWIIDVGSDVPRLVTAYPKD